MTTATAVAGGPRQSMKSRTIVARTLALCAAGALLIAGAAGAAEIKVMISGGFSAAYRMLVPECEASTQNTVTTAAGPSMGNTQQAIPNRLQRGEPADVLILVDSALDELI